MTEVEAGWYEDPTGKFELRYWEGKRWSEHVADVEGTQSTDPAPERGLLAPPIRGVSGKHKTRARLIASLKRSGKYNKPLERGDWAGVNIFGGDWNEYANVVLSAAILETLQDIDARLEHLDGVVQALSTQIAGSAGPTDAATS